MANGEDFEWAIYKSTSFQVPPYNVTHNGRKMRFNPDSKDLLVTRNDNYDIFDPLNDTMI